MNKILLPGGFPELTPEKQAVENNIKDIIRCNYEKFGYVNIETPAIESNKVLTSKGGDEVSKQIFGTYGLKQGAEDLKDFSLHFDLTVPLARYVVDNENKIKFPFKRYQTQKVWRGERQQRGRFKEFTQCDVDVIGENLNINYDIDVIHVLYNTLKGIFDFANINKGIEVHLNNRNFIDGLCMHFHIEGDDKKDFYRLLDDYYKITGDEFINGKEIEDYRTSSSGEKSIKKRGLKDIIPESYKRVLKILKTDIEDLVFEDDNLEKSFSELKESYQKLKSKGVNVVFDPFITRGLDYYTGTVFETFISDYFDFGSICSGGRFDNLVGDIRKVSNKKGINYGGVGGSIGLTRLFSRLDDSGLLNKKVPLTQTIIFNVPGSELGYKEKIGNILREGGITTDIYYEDDKLGKQFTYADSKKIPFGIFAGTDEEEKNSVVVKNLDNRESDIVKIDELVSYINKKLGNILK